MANRNIEETANILAKERVAELVSKAREVVGSIRGVAPTTAKVIDAFARLIESYAQDDKLD